MARPTSDYVDNADGTVTHTPTGLMWQRCAVGQTLNAAGRCAGIARTYTWDQVKTVSSRLSGYTDWRLPTEDELISLVDYKTLMPALNARIFPDTPLGLYGESSNFWSASTFVGPSDCSWMVTFSHGVVGAACGNPGGAFQVRLVRTVNGVTPSTQGESLTLAASWNLLGNGRNQPLPVASVFGDATRVTTVWKWDVANSGWQFYAPFMKAQELQNYAASMGYGVLSEISAGEGFWVNVKKPFTVTLPNGRAVLAADFQSGGTKALTDGWNLISLGDASSASEFNNALGISPVTGVVPQNLTTLWAWDNSRTQWYFYSPQLDAKGGTVLTDFVTNKGYLDFTLSNRLLEPGTGFWVNKPTITTSNLPAEAVDTYIFATRYFGEWTLVNNAQDGTSQIKSDQYGDFGIYIGTNASGIPVNAPFWWGGVYGYGSLGWGWGLDTANRPAYIGGFVNAPHNGLALVSNNKILNIEVSANKELQTPNTKFDVLLVGPTSGTGASVCTPELIRTLTIVPGYQVPDNGPFIDLINYAIPLNEFTLKTPCAYTTTAEALAAGVESVHIRLTDFNMQFSTTGVGSSLYPNGLSLGRITFN